MSDFWWGVLFATCLTIPIRVLFSQYTIWTYRRGWVMRWETKEQAYCNDLKALREGNTNE